jgi:hypothetical protein
MIEGRGERWRELHRCQHANTQRDEDVLHVWGTGLAVTSATRHVRAGRMIANLIVVVGYSMTMFNRVQI